MHSRCSGYPWGKDPAQSGHGCDALGCQHIPIARLQGQGTKKACQIRAVIDPRATVTKGTIDEILAIEANNLYDGAISDELQAAKADSAQWRHMKFGLGIRRGYFKFFFLVNMVIPIH